MYTYHGARHSSTSAGSTIANIQFHYSNTLCRVVTVVMAISGIVFTGMSWNIPQVCTASLQLSSSLR